MNSSEEQALYLLKSNGVQTAKVVAERLKVTMMGARQHLLKLESQGLVAKKECPAERGRPKQYWQLTTLGHQRFPDRHSDLTLDLIISTREVFGEKGLNKLISHREKEMREKYTVSLQSCRSLKDKVKCLAKLRSEEGYMADWQEEKRGNYLLNENHCPICAAATQCQSLCRSELKIFQHALGQGVKVEREQYLLEGARRCSYRITITKP